MFKTVRELLGTLIAAACFVTTTSAGGQSRTSETVRISNSVNKNILRQLDQPAEPAAPEPDKKKAVDFLIQWGIAYDRESGQENTLSAPVLLSASRNNWYLEVSRDAYQQATSDGSRSSGVGDIAMIGTYTFNFGNAERYSMTIEFEWDAPTHGNVGSRNASQALRVTLSRKFATTWKSLVKAGIGRDGDVREGISRYARSLAVQVQNQYGPTDNAVASLTAETVWRAGAPNKTAVRAEADVPLFGRKDWTSIFAVGQAWTGGKSSTLLEFDVAWAF